MKIRKGSFAYGVGCTDVIPYLLKTAFVHVCQRLLDEGPVRPAAFFLGEENTNPDIDSPRRSVGIETPPGWRFSHHRLDALFLNVAGCAFSSEVVVMAPVKGRRQPGEAARKYEVLPEGGVRTRFFFSWEVRGSVRPDGVYQGCERYWLAGVRVFPDGVTVNGPEGEERTNAILEFAEVTGSFMPGVGCMKYPRIRNIAAAN